MLNGKKILIAAGGTGGHINPALSVAKLIRERCPNAKILMVGTADKIEARLVPAAGFDFATIDISGFQRSLSFKNIKRNIGTVSKLMRSSSQAKKIIDSFMPDVAVGFGGYVSGPVLRMAAKMRVPTAIHEQNAFPGVTNKALAKHADVVMLTVKDAEKYMNSKNPCVVTGLPVRGEILSADREISRAEMELDSRPLILSIGGSLGAETINRAMIELIAAKHKDGSCNFCHAYGQYGGFLPDALRKRGVNIESEKNIDVREYIDDMHRCLAAADLVIARAGASTLSELTAVGRASILIPSPNVAENHQYHNAMALVRNNAARIIEEKDLTPERLIDEVNSLIGNPAKLAEIAANAKKMAVLDAAERIYDIIDSLA